MRVRSRVRYWLTSIAALTALSGLAVAQQQTPPYLEARAVPHGKVQSVEYKSKSLDSDRKVVVYTPPGYDTSTSRYAVLYLLHGAGSDQTSWTERGKAQVILDNLG